MCAVAETSIPDFVLQAAHDALSVKPSRSVVTHGSNVPWDDWCGDGQLSVRTVSMTPMFKGSPQSGCPVGFQQLLAVGIIRCVSTMDERGNPPSEKEMQADSEAMIRDMNELGNVLQCLNVPRTLSSWIGWWRPHGPQGGMAGGEWEFNVRRTLPLS